MKIQLLSSLDSDLTITEQILSNRGIKISEVYHYLNTTDKDINSPLDFGETRMKSAAVAIVNCIKLDQRMLVVVDSDTDGFTSSAIFINYLHDLFPSYVENKLDWFLHSGKQHGLNDVSVDAKYNLIIVPDGGSNDLEQHKNFAAAGINILVLDHHEAEAVVTPAIIINNQMCDYPNKSLSGAGVVWQFCRYLDSLLGVDYANRYLDLTALGLVADMMDVKSLETKHIITQGFKDENLHNPFIRGMVDKNAFSLGGKITQTGAAWYIAPFINAMVRSGEKEEKELLFQSMLNFKAFQKIPSNKRGHKLGEMEDLITQALRTVSNVKSRQTKIEEETMERLEKLIEERDLLSHKVLLFLLNPGQVDPNIAGLAANKFMAKYQRPCCILTKVETEYGIYYQGSARGCDLAGIRNFKDVCEKTKCIEWAMGHQGAFGLSLSEAKVNDYIATTDKALEGMSNEPVYYVDFIYTNEDFSGQNVLDIAYMDEVWGSGMPEPYIALKGLKVKKDMVAVYSKKDLTLKITLSNKVALIMFHAPEELCDKLKDHNPSYYTIDIVAQCSANTYGSMVSPQLKIKDWEITGQSQWDF